MFASAEIALSEASERFKEADYLIIDLRRVSNMDTAAVQMIIWLAENTYSNNKNIYLTGTMDKYAVRKYIKNNMSKGHAKEVLRFEDIDSALESCEYKLLKEAEVVSDNFPKVDFHDHPLCNDMSDEEKNHLTSLSTIKSYSPDSYICKEGDEASVFYFILQGNVSVNLPMKNGTNQCVARFGAGGAFGEQAILEQTRRSADIIAKSEVVCMETNATKLLQEETNLANNIRVKLLSKIAIDLSHKLQMANREIRYLTI